MDPVAAPKRIRWQKRDFFGRPNIHNCHRKKFLSRITIEMDRGIVDGQEGKALQVKNPHRLRAAFEELPVAVFALTCSFLGMQSFERPAAIIGKRTNGIEVIMIVSVGRIALNRHDADDFSSASDRNKYLRG